MILAKPTKGSSFCALLYLSPDKRFRYAFGAFALLLAAKVTKLLPLLQLLAIYGKNPDNTLMFNVTVG